MEADPESAHPGVHGAGPVAVIGKTDQRVVHADGHGAATRRRAPHQRARPRARECQPRLHFGVQRERFGARQVEDAAAAVELEIALTTILESKGDAVRVSQKEVRRVHQHPVAGLRLDFETPVCGRCERFLHRPHLVGIIRAGPVGVVGLDEQDGGSHPSRLEDVRATELSPIEPDRVASQPRGQGDLIKELVFPAIDLPEQLPRDRVPIEVEEAGQPLHTLDAFGDAGEVLLLGVGVLSHRGQQAEGSGAHDGPNPKRAGVAARTRTADRHTEPPCSGVNVISL